MFRLLAPVPKTVSVACSGGVDSMAAVDFLRRNHTVSICFFNHGTQASEQAHQFLSTYCSDNNIVLKVESLMECCPRGVSQEEHWRNQRYKFLHSVDGTVVTAHHLDDCVETYLFNCLHGKSHTIPFSRQNVIRPFLTTPKSEFVSWCERHRVPWIEDHSNKDLRYSRNRIRHQIVPEALMVNPGLRKVVRKMILDQMSASAVL